MEKQRILIVGTCVLDIIHVCDEYPQEDTKKKCLDGNWQRGGNASNNCTVLRQLGAKCDFLGVISSVPAFQYLYEDCRERQIGISNCPKSDVIPPFSSVILATGKGTRTIIHTNPGFPILKYQDFDKITFKNYSWIHFEGRNMEETKQMIDKVWNHNQKNSQKAIKVSVELEQSNKALFVLGVKCDVVFVGKDNAKHMGWTTAKEAAYNSQQIIAHLKAEESQNVLTNPSIICPWGSKGADALNGVNNQYFSSKAVSVENIVDSLGAGDTFAAAVIYAMNNLKKDLFNAITYGNHVAAYKIQHRGYDCLKNFKL